MRGHAEYGNGGTILHYKYPTVSGTTKEATDDDFVRAAQWVPSKELLDGTSFRGFTLGAFGSRHRISIA